MRFTMLLALLALTAPGCSRTPTARPAPAAVAGKVTRGGQPVGDLVITFQPLDVGHLGAFPLKPDGTFQGEMIAGEYTYYVAKGATPKSPAALAKIDAKFQEPNLERRVAIAPGEPIQIALD
ncbi:MAG TPA: hypothetical protein VEQ85_16595 [Lacipirellulaceae bacterium]|nr:hypothetical protein [Lacipirellulaceae bacterium]